VPSCNKFWLYLQDGLWEGDTFLIFDEFLDSSQPYIDIGAWVGPTVLYGAQISGHCYAVEPDGVAFKILRDNVNLNEEIKDKISLYNCCIGETSGDAKLGTKTIFGDSMTSLLYSDQKNSITVKSLTFSDFISANKINACNFIKIDIES
jgi:FkbM family methyltransferase